MSSPSVMSLPVQVVDALHRHAFSHTFGLLLFEGGDPERKEDSEGATGVGVQIGSRFFVATAGHNLCRVPDEGVILVHEDRIATVPTPFLRRWPGPDDRSAPSPDVGYIELAPEVAKRSNKRFVPFEQILLGFRRIGIDCVLVGFPVERISQELTHKERLYNLRAMGFTTKTVTLPKTHNEDAHFALDYRESGFDVSNGAVLVSPHLSGVSGAGVWTFPRPSSAGIWAPELAPLVGIEHGWKREAGHIYCAQMQHWLEVIRRDYSDLQ